MNEIPSFVPGPESSGELRKETISEREVPFDENVFSVFDAAVASVVDEKKRKMLEGVGVTLKRDAFRDVERQLDLLGDIPPSDQSVSDKGGFSEFNKDIDHKVGHDMSELTVGLQMAGLRPSWLSEDPRKVRLLHERASLRYALGVVNEYEQAVKEKERAKDFFKRKGLEKVLGEKFMRERILKKIQALPETIRENLFKIYK